MQSRTKWSRRYVLAAGSAAAIAANLPPAARAAAQLGKPEKTALNLGLASFGSNFLPVYVAAARTFKEQGLDVQLLGFRGETWAQLKQKKIGVATFGSLTDALTRYILRKHGLDPVHDVQIIQAGGSQSGFEALESGKIDAVILSAPFKWRAAADGYTVLGTQQHDIAPRWPKNLFMAKSAFLKDNPNTVRAFLRAYVAAIRFARHNRDSAVKILMDQLKFTRPDAGGAYDSALADMDETGHLPQASMATFWTVTVENGDVDKPWPESKYFDRRYVDSFKQWAP